MRNLNLWLNNIIFLLAVLLQCYRYLQFVETLPSPGIFVGIFRFLLQPKRFHQVSKLLLLLHKRHKSVSNDRAPNGISGHPLYRRTSAALSLQSFQVHCLPWKGFPLEDTLLPLLERTSLCHQKRSFLSK
ncbi:unnamed protein product [Caretta caretta]